MRNHIHHVGAVRIDPHGLASRHSNASARSGLNEDAIRAIVLDDIRLLDGGHHEVTGCSTRRTGAAQAQVARRLRRVSIRQGQRDVGASEGDIRRADYGLFHSGAKVGVRDVPPRGAVLTRGHKLDFKGAVRTRHFLSLRRPLRLLGAVSFAETHPFAIVRLNLLHSFGGISCAVVRNRNGYAAIVTYRFCSGRTVNAGARRAQDQAQRQRPQPFRH